jgi:hypothetical protein
MDFLESGDVPVADKIHFVVKCAHLATFNMSASEVAYIALAEEYALRTDGSDRYDLARAYEAAKEQCSGLAAAEVTRLLQTCLTFNVLFERIPVSVNAARYALLGWGNNSFAEMYALLPESYRSKKATIPV